MKLMLAAITAFLVSSALPMGIDAQVQEQKKITPLTVIEAQDWEDISNIVAGDTAQLRHDQTLLDRTRDDILRSHGYDEKRGGLCHTAEILDKYVLYTPNGCLTGVIWGSGSTITMDGRGSVSNVTGSITGSFQGANHATR
jgi:hypothetical protein